MQSVIKSLRVLEAVADRQPVGVSELARLLDVPKSTVQRALKTLAEAGWISGSGNETTKWRLTTKVLRIAGRAGGESGLRVTALPVMEELHAATEESIHLTVPEGDHVVLIDRIDSTRPVRTYLPLGLVAPLHGSATGKAILAFSSADVVERLIASGLTRPTERTITDPDVLRAELQHIREIGYATNHAEWRDDVAAVAAAIRDPSGTPIAAISISMPSHRMSAQLEESYGQLVRSAVERVNAKLG